MSALSLVFMDLCRPSTTDLACLHACGDSTHLVRLAECFWSRRSPPPAAPRCALRLRWYPCGTGLGGHTPRTVARSRRRAGRGPRQPRRRDSRASVAPTLADLRVCWGGRDRLLRVAEVADHLGLCNATVYRL